MHIKPRAAPASTVAPAHSKGIQMNDISLREIVAFSIAVLCATAALVAAGLGA